MLLERKVLTIGITMLIYTSGKYTWAYIIPEYDELDKLKKILTFFYRQERTLLLTSNFIKEILENDTAKF